jgi:hypothetical protein
MRHAMEQCDTEAAYFQNKLAEREAHLQEMRSDVSQLSEQIASEQNLHAQRGEAHAAQAAALASMIAALRRGLCRVDAGEDAAAAAAAAAEGGGSGARAPLLAAELRRAGPRRERDGWPAAAAAATTPSPSYPGPEIGPGWAGRHDQALMDPAGVPDAATARAVDHGHTAGKPLALHGPAAAWLIPSGSEPGGAIYAAPPSSRQGPGKASPAVSPAPATGAPSAPADAGSDAPSRAVERPSAPERDSDGLG